MRLDPFTTIDATPEAKEAFEAAIDRTVQIKKATDIIPEPIDWIWNGWLAAGKLHVLGGKPGTGKTTISMALAAIVSTGGCWPDGTRSPVGNVVIWTGEDDPADTLIPRLILSGVDLTHVNFISGVQDKNEKLPFDPARDIEALKRKLAEIGNVRLLIIDPIVSAISGDSHKNAEVRRGLQPLADLAASMKCVLLGITHLTKGTNGREPVERLTGSLAFGAVPRVVMVVAKHLEEGEDGRIVRLLLRAKSNIGPDSGGFEYDLQQKEIETNPGIFASYVQWGNTVEGTAKEILATAEQNLDEATGESVITVSDWLLQLLMEEQGKLSKRDVMRAAHGMGYKERTVHRARKKAGVIVKQSGFGKDKQSIWILPNMSASDSIMPIMPNKLSGTYGTYGGKHEENDLVEVEI